jgi:hypothetical protein
MPVQTDVKRLLALLVGGNPLPNYLSALALRPDKIVLVHSPQTQRAAENLQRTLTNALEWRTEIELACVPDAASAAEVRQTLKRLMGSHSRGWHILLNYTGGTKVMAASAARVFYENGGNSADASYLDDGGPDASPRLRFDNGEVRTLSELQTPPLALETVLNLHGCRLQRSTRKEPAPKREDVNEIARKVLSEPGLAGRLHRQMKEAFPKEDPQRCLETPFDPQALDLQLSIGKFPTEEQIGGLSRQERESWFQQWRRFLSGCWLEDWVASRIRETGLLSEGCEVVSGFYVFRRGAGESRPPQSEIDVALVRNYRSYFISCTTAADKATCKQKLFEIAVRSRQLAGDLARPALVCLADGGTLTDLRAEMDDEPSPTGAFRVRGLMSVHVFGLEDLRTWAGWQGAPPNLESLKKWLES